MKFDALIHKAAQLECDFVATGHYARVEKDSNSENYRLRKGVDLAKDQSYFLYHLNQENLPLIKDYLRFKLINSFPFVS